jgi:pheromone shutdown protein TraB
MRNPNVDSNIFKRAWTKVSPYENTLTMLEDPATGKKLYLIGTTNSSTALAARTKKLIEEVKPETVYAQTCQTWYDRVKGLEFKNQEQFNRINGELNDILFKRVNELPNNLRGLMVKSRFYAWAGFMNLHMNFPNDFNPIQPGVEILWGLQAAEKVGASVKYFGQIFNPLVVSSIAHEDGVNPLRVLARWLKGESFSRWRTETSDFWSLLNTTGGPAFSENLDNKYMAWFVKWLERITPEYKYILVDKENERILRTLLESSDKKIVAVVNQYHIPGIEAAWRRATGTEVSPLLS